MTGALMLAAGLALATPRDESAASLKSALAALDLPIEVIPATTPRAFLVLVTGDGGWSHLDAAVAAQLAEDGVSTVGLNALRYFWQERQVENAADDLLKILREVARERLPIFVGGYSFGAEVVPVLLDRPLFTRESLSGIILFAPGPYASFEVHLSDWLRTKEKPTPHKVLDHLAALAGWPVLCLAPEKDEESICPALAGKERREVVLLPGGHHFAGDYERLGREAARFIGAILPPGSQPESTPATAPPGARTGTQTAPSPDGAGPQPGPP
ncbi:MAG TPA: AcvB/VirJ family lysyl-phosphatidylglycerol hydrolase [Candidatus Polarisedimenticolia bacterium]|nr:AcvB/VirJ family lysyl-phosphatidylglycerol hydrolase [Candidatus Polarisedimenticolia bacterium]